MTHGDLPCTRAGANRDAVARAPLPAAAPALRYYKGALPLLLPMKGLFVE